MRVPIRFELPTNLQVDCINTYLHKTAQNVEEQTSISILDAREKNTFEWVQILVIALFSSFGITQAPGF